MQLIAEGYPHDPVLDMALSHALLRAVASGELPETARVFRPGPTVALGRLDALTPRFDEARAAAVRHGRTPVLRLGGGRAACYDRESVVMELVTRSTSVAQGTQDRFRSGVAVIAEALASLGVHTRAGEPESSYCPGRWSLHLPGGPKVVGAAQRSIPGASLVTAVVVVGGGERLRAVLVDVYEALGLPWVSSTAGALDDAYHAIRAADVVLALSHELRNTLGTRDATVSPDTLAAAWAIAPLHACRLR